MATDGNARWAYVGLGAAALFAAGSVVAVTLAGDQRRADAESAGSSSVEWDARYAAAASAIDAWEAEQQQAACEFDDRAVGAVQLEAQFAQAIEAAAIVDDAYLIINRADRVAFEERRIATAEALSEGFTSEADVAVAAEYEGVDDVLTACLADPAPTVQAPSGVITPAAVEELEARAAELGDDPAPETARFDELDEAVSTFGPVVLQAADARVRVNGLDATADALAAATEPLRDQTAPVQTIDGLAALTAHAQAALELQSAIAAEEAQTEEQAVPTPEPQPRPQRPAPAPAPNPEPVPEPEPEPEPTDPGDGGDSPVPPLIPGP